MTKQEEIREGTLFTLSRREVWLKDDDVTALFNYLRSQGVMIKVDRELPLSPYRSANEQPWQGCHQIYTLSQNEMLKADYVAVESLIKEE